MPLGSNSRYLALRARRRRRRLETILRATLIIIIVFGGAALVALVPLFSEGIATCH